MTKRGLLHHPCGHQTPVPGPDRRTDQLCTSCQVKASEHERWSCSCFVHDADDQFGCAMHAATGCGLCTNAQAHALDPQAEEVGPRTCGHQGATFRLQGALYCPRCAPRAWQHFVHQGHADEPPVVALVVSEARP